MHCISITITSHNGRVEQPHLPCLPCTRPISLRRQGLNKRRCGAYRGGYSGGYNGVWGAPASSRATVRRYRLISRATARVGRPRVSSVDGNPTLWKASRTSSRLVSPAWGRGHVHPRRFCAKSRKLGRGRGGSSCTRSTQPRASRLGGGGLNHRHGPVAGTKSTSGPLGGIFKSSTGHGECSSGRTLRTLRAVTASAGFGHCLRPTTAILLIIRGASALVSGHGVFAQPALDRPRMTL